MHPNLNTMFVELLKKFKETTDISANHPKYIGMLSNGSLIIDDVTNTLPYVNNVGVNKLNCFNTAEWLLNDEKDLAMIHRLGSMPVGIRTKRDYCFDPSKNYGLQLIESKVYTDENLDTINYFCPIEDINLAVTTILSSIESDEPKYCHLIKETDFIDLLINICSTGYVRKILCSSNAMFWIDLYYRVKDFKTVYAFSYGRHTYNKRPVFVDEYDFLIIDTDLLKNNKMSFVDMDRLLGNAPIKNDLVATYIWLNEHLFKEAEPYEGLVLQYKNRHVSLEDVYQEFNIRPSDGFLFTNVTTEISTKRMTVRPIMDTIVDEVDHYSQLGGSVTHSIKKVFSELATAVHEVKTIYMKDGNELLLSCEYPDDTLKLDDWNEVLESPDKRNVYHYTLNATLLIKGKKLDKDLPGILLTYGIVLAKLAASSGYICGELTVLFNNVTMELDDLHNLIADAEMIDAYATLPYKITANELWSGGSNKSDLDFSSQYVTSVLNGGDPTQSTPKLILI